MNKETEIKLRVSVQPWLLCDHPLLKKRNKVVGNNANCSISILIRLRDLAKARLPCAFAVMARSLSGPETHAVKCCRLVERNEYAGVIQRAELDLSKLDDSCWPQRPGRERTESTGADFHHRLIGESGYRLGHGGAKVMIEAALDLVQVIAGDGQRKSASWSWNCARADRMRCWNWR
jgi:hypothetical protein